MQTRKKAPKDLMHDNVKLLGPFANKTVKVDSVIHRNDSAIQI